MTSSDTYYSSETYESIISSDAYESITSSDTYESITSSDTYYSSETYQCIAESEAPDTHADTVTRTGSIIVSEVPLRTTQGLVGVVDTDACNAPSPPNTTRDTHHNRHQQVQAEQVSFSPLA